MNVPVFFYKVIYGVITPIILFMTIIFNFRMHAKCASTEDLLNLVNTLNVRQNLYTTDTKLSEEDRKSIGEILDSGKTKSEKIDALLKNLDNINQSQLEDYLKIIDNRDTVTRVKKSTNIALLMNILALLLLFIDTAMIIYITKKDDEDGVSTKLLIMFILINFYMAITFTLSLSQSVHCHKNRIKGFNFTSRTGVLGLNIIALILCAILFLFVTLGSVEDKDIIASGPKGIFSAFKGLTNKSKTTPSVTPASVIVSSPAAVVPPPPP